MGLVYPVLEVLVYAVFDVLVGVAASFVVFLKFGEELFQRVREVSAYFLDSEALEEIVDQHAPNRG